MSLDQQFLELKRKTNSITANPLLDCFEQYDLRALDDHAASDEFIFEKRKKILNLIKGIDIDFNPKLKSAYDEYSEALFYLRLKAKFDDVSRVKEGTVKSPDFKINFKANVNGDLKDFQVFTELKTMSFAGGNENYNDAMTQGIEARIDIDDQLKRGKKVAFGITVTRPLFRHNREYSSDSVKAVIEIMIEKIEQNLKRDQFAHGETILVIDVKQIILPADGLEGYVPVFREKRLLSYVSGPQWNIAFGRTGHIVFKAIDFEGEINVEGDLTKEGILPSRDWIKAIVFVEHAAKYDESKIMGLVRYGETSEAVMSFLYTLCDFVNDSRNTRGWQQNQNDK